ncbi:MAG: hypothetical protein WC242_02130 [Candidatus Paceibacterota bacterium]|jgi:hypothetical protein
MTNEFENKKPESLDQQQRELNKEEGEIINLDNELIFKKLHVKRDEYEQRIKKYEDKVASETLTFDDLREIRDAIHKKLVLDHLLAIGKTTFDSTKIFVKQELLKPTRIGSREIDIGYDVVDMINAWHVIVDYVKTGGGNVDGGTGLPEIEQK